MKNQKLISGMLAVSMAVSACTSSSGGPAGITQPTVQDQVSQLGVAQEKWIQLTASENPNFALAELLTPWLWSLDSKSLESIRSRRISGDLDPSVRDAVQTKLDSLKQAMIFGENSFIQDETLLKGAVFSQVTQLESQGAFALQIRLQTAAEAQAQAYMKVQAAFNEKIKKDAKEIGREVVAGLGPKALEQINNTKNKNPKAAIQEIYQVLKQWDQRLAGYDFADQDAHKLLLYGYIAAELYDYLKDHPTVQDIVHTVDEVRAVGEKVKEVRLILASMDKYNDTLAEGWEKMKSGMQGIQKDIQNNPDWNIDPNLKITDESKKASVKLVTDLLLGQDDPASPEEKSFLSKPHPLSQNAKTFFEGAAKTAGAVDGMIDGARVIAQTLGIQIDPGLEDALNTAKKITQGVQVAEQVASAFASDGLMGAFGALAGPGGAALVMGPVGAGAMAVGQMQMNAELGKINMKLDKVIEMQKQILDLQKQTLAKLDDLSHKLDEYHNQEMLAIEGVQDEVLENRSAIRMQIDSDLSACKNLVNRVNSISNSGVNVPVNMLSTRTVQNTLAQALAVPSVRQALLNESSLRQSFARCGVAMGNAFSHKAIVETPLKAALDGKPGVATPLQLRKKRFDPALLTLASANQGKNYEKMALHLPAANFSGLDRKDFYAKRSLGSQDNSLGTDLSEMVSIYALERYVSVLLALHPMLAVSGEAWNSLPNAVESSWNGSSAVAQKQNQSEFWLRSALETIQVAIAQQSLLAGEPLLTNLVGKMETIVAEPVSCEAKDSKYCFVRENEVMAKNLLHYYLYLRAKDPNFVAAYTQAFSTNSVQDMVKALGIPFIGHLEAPANVSLVWKAESKVSISLPKPEDLTKGIINYPPELSLLVKMQEKVADELVKVVPNSLKPPEQQLLTELILFKQPTQ
ncbi:MAG: hypothetical protein JSU04_07105 [Bdellovibrionales bacterium]|nr:hypothetical protein [Bdellovibrionales bacterium]